jgi:hypothetical protein
MHNVDMNMAMAKRCNMQIVIVDFNKYNVILVTGNMDIDGGFLIQKIGEFLEVSKRGPGR